MNAHRQDFFSFPLDPFQEEACQAIDGGENVLVCAPTGAGKTVVAEWATMAALSAGKRCFYTTPLKALSNQKFFDLCQRFGEEHVGLSTGDISIRSSANLVVMTTEVYRNMLYAAAPGESNPALRNLASVILDECHYMNDSDRGTVWEEAIIYSPREVQLVGLSATVANAEEMKEWIEDIHGPTRLVITDFRPVPLSHYYFRKEKMLRVFEGNGRKPNPKLFRFKSQKAPRRRGRQRLSVLCEPAKLVGRLQSQEMLPAIYFVFSRRGCEKMMESCRGVIRLTSRERDQIDLMIRTRAASNPEILEHPHLDSLRRGLAVHHAGVLPLWKSLVEQLFAEGLLKVVFATETLAAGINMPARTTVISALSKFTGEGMRPLTGSEMLQMSGRAGRRGMDKVGHVVIGAHRKEPVEMVLGLAKARPEPLESHFLPSYGMVLNLLQRRSREMVKSLLLRSFGQFQHRRRQLSRGLSPEQVGKEFDPPCPGPRGDRAAYLKLNGRRRRVRGMLKDYEYALASRENSKSQRRELKRERDALEQEQIEIGIARKGSPCHHCVNYKECGRLFEEFGEEHRPSHWEEFVALSDLLTEAGHLIDDKPSQTGLLLAQLRATNVYAVGEAFLGPTMEHLEELEESSFGGLCCFLVSEPARRDRYTPPKASAELSSLLTRIGHLFEDIESEQLDHGLERRLPEEPLFCGVAELWVKGFSWEALCEMSGMSGGDLFRMLRRTYDLSRQVEHWDGAPEELRAIARSTNRLLLRGPLAENVSFFESVEGDPELANESGAQERELPKLDELPSLGRGGSESRSGEKERPSRPKGTKRRRLFKRRGGKTR